MPARPLALRPPPRRRRDQQACRRRNSKADHGASTDRPLANLASKTLNLQAKDLVKALSKDEYIDEDASLNDALRRLADTRYLSLIAMRRGENVGILRVVDVFQNVCYRLRSKVE